MGHAGGLVGLDAVCRKISEGAFDGCVVAGVDSYLAPETLEDLDSKDQLHGAGPHNNAWGFVPGEAAGAALMLSERALTRVTLDALASLESVGTAVESNRINTETVCVGEGLTAAFRAGLAGLPLGAKVSDIYCDLNGEPYRADEFGFASLRIGEAFVSASDFVAPADCWGDVSAASAPLAMVLSAVAGLKAYCKGPYTFIWASSESGERGAALLRIPTREP
jgi:3-oxoacyl-[acyl-carrier-protein] synthase-1